MATILPALSNFILGIIMRLYIIFHKCRVLFPSISFPELPLLWLQDRIGEHVLRVRKERPGVGRVDLLHLMIDAVTEHPITVRYIKTHNVAF